MSNIGVATIFKTGGNELHKKTTTATTKKTSRSFLLMNIGQWLEELNQSINLTQPRRAVGLSSIRVDCYGFDGLR